MQGFKSHENYKKTERKYIWIQVGMSFFNDTTIRRLERKPNGATAIFAYIKLMTQACKFNGELRNDDGEPIKREDFCLWFMNPDIDELEEAFDLLIESDLITLLPDKGVYYLRDTEILTGSRTTAADRMRTSRENKADQATDQTKDEPKKEQEQEQESRDQVSPKAPKKPKKKTPENDKKASKVVDIKTGESIEPKTDPVAEVVSYLREKTGYNYRPETKSTQRLVNARFKEGYTVDDLERIIDVKAAEWLDNEKMRRYLSPDTLFSQKNAEKYLIQARESLAYMFHDKDGETSDTMAYLMEDES